MLNQGPEETATAPAWFHLGRTAEAREDWEGAAELYGRLVDRYPAAELADDALGSLAALTEKRFECRRARPCYQRLVEEYSRSGWAAVAGAVSLEGTAAGGAGAVSTNSYPSWAAVENPEVHMKRIPDVGIVAVYLLGVAVYTFPLVLDFTRPFSEPGDYLLTVYRLSWQMHALLTQPWDFFQANIMHPTASSLAVATPLNTSQLLFFARKSVLG